MAHVGQSSCFAEASGLFYFTGMQGCLGEKVQPEFLYRWVLGP